MIGLVEDCTQNNYVDPTRYNYNRALSTYEEGLVLIDKALNITIECPRNPDLNWEKACIMLQKMKKTRKEVLIRIADTQVPRPQDLMMEAPPSYEEAIASSPSLSPSLTPSLTPGSSHQAFPHSSLSPSTPPLTYSELGEALRNLKVETSTQSAQVIFTFNNVRIYFISPNGHVSAPSEPNQLRILQLEDGGENGVPKFFLQVGDWFYPLVPDVSPCYRSEYGAFILPDLHSPIEGSAVGLILPPESDESMYGFLTDVLQGIVSKTSPPQKPPQIPPQAPPQAPFEVPPQAPIPPRRTKVKRETGMSGSISRGIVSGAQYISTGLVKGAEKAGQLMNSTTPKIKSKLQPEPTPRDLPPGVRKGVKVARDVTDTAANVTGYIAGKVGGATMALGRYLAPHIQRGGTKLLNKAGVAQDKASEQVGGVLTVAAGAVEGFGTVYTGLEQAAAILGTSLTNNTVEIVRHKYGEPMGEVTGNTLFTVGNVLSTTNNVQNLTPKGIAKKTAKNAGKAVLETHSTSKKLELDENHSPPK